MVHADRALARAPLLNVGGLRQWGASEGIEAYFERLNQDAPVAHRRIQTLQARQSRLDQGFVPYRDDQGQARMLSPRSGLPQCFLGESRSSGFELWVDFQRPQAAPLAISLGLPLFGELRLRLRGRELQVPAGSGVLVDPAELESSLLPNGFHMLEVFLLKSDLQALASQWNPVAAECRWQFAPSLSPELARRVLFMSLEAAAQLEQVAGQPGANLLFRRWLDLIGLTLIQSCAQLASPSARSATSPRPAVQRALDYMHAHADAAIGLTDMARAAHLSISSLTRQFKSQLGQTPYAVLRDIRLQRARADLQADDELRVRDAALRWGFQNASKFSAAYLARYGELPSQARARRSA